jgi:long-subunit fatty acid transport protein
MGARFSTILRILVLAGALLSGPVLVAQEVPTTFQFSFSNPGARSMGFGGAFAALADDATAAFANPAGLTQLSKPELSIEGRLWDYSTPFTEGGRVNGTPTGILLDDTAGLRIGTSSETISGVSFLSFVYPRRDWSLAFYRHESANFEIVSETQGLFKGFASDPPAFLRDDERRAFTDLEVVSYGISGSYRLNEGLSVGLGLSYAVGEMTSRTELFAPLAVTLPEGPFGRNSFSPAALEVSTTLTVDSSDLTFNAGLLWDLPARWSLGAFYRDGPDFDLQAVVVAGPAQDNPAGTVLLTVSSPIGFPAVFGLGLAHRSSSDAVTMSLEWDRVEYSTIIDSLEPEVELAVDDGDEFHLGFEYVFLDLIPIVALRSGVWLDPDHRLRFTGDQRDPTAALLRPGDDTWHYAVGIGLAFETFQIDLAVDLSDLIDTASFSAIYSF